MRYFQTGQKQINHQPIIDRSMKISGAIIQNRNIRKTDDGTFLASYKGKSIYVSDDHGFGKPKYDHLTRYIIEVTDNKTGLFDVETCKDCHTINDAIREALKGAILINI